MVLFLEKESKKERERDGRSSSSEVRSREPISSDEEMEQPPHYKEINRQKSDKTRPEKSENESRSGQSRRSVERKASGDRKRVNDRKGWGIDCQESFIEIIK